MLTKNKNLIRFLVFTIVGLSGCDGSEKTQFALYFKTDIDNLIGWVNHPSFIKTEDAYSSIYVCRINNDVKTTYPFYLPNNEVICGANNIVEIKIAGMIYFYENDGDCSLIVELKNDDIVVKTFEKKITTNEIKIKTWTIVELLLPIKEEGFNKNNYILSTYFKQNGNSEILIDDFIIHYRD